MADYSLKERKYHLKHALEDPWNYDIYYKGTIETYRKKLIEDFIDYIRHPEKYGYKSESGCEDFIDVINKRFGVEGKK